MATKKASAKHRTTADRKGKGQVEKVMHEFKHHELKSGGKRKVTNRKQAIAIALSEAREAGANIPDKPRGGAKKKSAGAKRKSTTKTTRKAAKKSSSKKSAPRKRSGARR